MINEASLGVDQYNLYIYIYLQIRECRARIRWSWWRRYAAGSCEWWRCSCPLAGVSSGTPRAYRRACAVWSAATPSRCRVRRPAACPDCRGSSAGVWTAPWSLECQKQRCGFCQNAIVARISVCIFWKVRIIFGLELSRSQARIKSPIKKFWAYFRERKSSVVFVLRHFISYPNDV